jgi:hypothetical protein
MRNDLRELLQEVRELAPVDIAGFLIAPLRRPFAISKRVTGDGALSTSQIEGKSRIGMIGLSKTRPQIDIFIFLHNFEPPDMDTSKSGEGNSVWLFTGR